MHTASSVNVISVFLLLEAVYLLRAAVSRLQVRNAPLSANAFLFFSGCGLGLAGVLSVVVGLSNLALAAGLAAGVIASVIYPAAAVSFLVCALLLRPWELFPELTVLTYLPKLLAGLALASWLIESFRSERRSFIWNPACTWLCMFIAWLLFSAAFSGMALKGIKYIAEHFVPIAVLTFLIINSISNKSDLSLLQNTLKISVLGLVLTAFFFTFFDPANDTGEFRLIGPQGTFSNSNDLASLIILVLPFTVFSLFACERSRFVRIFEGLALIVFMGGVVASESRGAVVAVAAALTVYLLYTVRLNKTVLAAGLCSMIILPMLFFSALQRSQSDLEESTSSRMNYLIAGLKMAKHSPIVGVGAGNYPKLYEQYTPGFLEWGERTAHSSWVLVLAEGGFVGLFFLAGLYLSAIVPAWQVRNKAPEFLLSMVGYGIAMSLLSHAYLFVPYLLFASVMVGVRVNGAYESRKLAALVVMSLMLLASGEQAYAQTISGSAGIDKPLADYSPHTSSVIKLSGSRGEIVNFLLKVKADRCFRYTIDHLRNTSSRENFAVNFFKMPPVYTKHPSFRGAVVGKYYDPLVPDKSGMFCGTGGEDVWYLGEVEIPETAVPGRHRSKIQLGNKTGLEIDLTVWQMQIKSRPALPAYMELSTWYNLKGHYGKWQEGEEVLAKKYLAEMKRHRIMPIKTYISHPEPVLRGDRGYLLDLKHFPSPEKSYYALNIKARPDWSYFDFPSVEPEEIEASSTDNYFVAIENTLPALKRSGRALIYLWDEPKRSDFPVLIKLAEKVRKLAPSVKIMTTVPPYGELKDFIDIFAPVMDEFEAAGFPAPLEYKKIQKRGGEVWWYVSCMSHGCTSPEDSGTPDFVIERPSAYIRSIGWISQRYSIDAFLYYMVNYAYQFYPKRDPWESVWDFSGNGDGTLFYPGRPGEHGMSSHQPVPSIRLKLWRESSYDADYLSWIKRCRIKPSWFEREQRRLVLSTRKWSRSYADYQNLRNRIGDYLNANLNICGING